jgi:hypothetical protein
LRHVSHPGTIIPPARTLIDIRKGEDQQGKLVKGLAVKGEVTEEDDQLKDAWSI